MWKAQLALRANHKKTETWLILPPEHRPPAATAQTVLSVILREVYLLHARYSAIAAVALLLEAVVLSLWRGQ
jgi:hypothetical protein